MMPPKDQMEKLQQQQQRFVDAEQQAPMSDEPRMIAEGFGPPDIGPPLLDENFDDDNVRFDNEELEQSYANFNDEPELEQPYEDDEEVVNFTAPEEDEEPEGYPVPPSLSQPGKRFAEPETVFPGGPTISEVNSWKKQFNIEGHGVFINEYAGEYFIWRTLNREEYREVMNLPNMDPLQREEILCELATLFPYEYNFTSMATKRAGIPATMAQDIMQESGFRRPAPPVRL